MNNNLTQHPPRSPREQLGGIVTLPRFIDKVRAQNDGTIGAYFSGPDSVCDVKLCDFLGIDYDAFKAEAAKGGDDEALLVWIQANGAVPSPEEISKWSAEYTSLLAKDDAPRHAYILDLLGKLNLDPETTTTFDWLDADDKASFK